MQKHVHLVQVGSLQALKGRNNIAQANGLGFGHPPKPQALKGRTIEAQASGLGQIKARLNKEPCKGEIRNYDSVPDVTFIVFNSISLQ